MRLCPDALEEYYDRDNDEDELSEAPTCYEALNWSRCMVTRIERALAAYNVRETDARRMELVRAAIRERDDPGLPDWKREDGAEVIGSKLRRRLGLRPTNEP